jgi:hypothetical protein
MYAIRRYRAATNAWCWQVNFKRSKGQKHAAIRKEVSIAFQK